MKIRIEGTVGEVERKNEHQFKHCLTLKVGGRWRDTVCVVKTPEAALSQRNNIKGNSTSQMR